jgi:protein TonB
VAAIRQASYFPTKALRKRELGETMVKFTVGRNGSVSGLAVVHSSGSKLLDETAVKIVGKAANHFPPIPASISKDSLDYVVPIVFKKRKSTKK